VIALAGAEPAGLPQGESSLDLGDAVCRPDDVIAVTFTSGTTGLPKGCMVDHAWALTATETALRIHPYASEDRIFYPVKFFYMDAPLALLRALACGGAFVAARGFSVSRFWDVVRSRGVTIVSTIASMPAWLLKAPPARNDRDHGVRFAIQAQIAPELHAAMTERWGFPWLENYGMTEVGIIARVPRPCSTRRNAAIRISPAASEIIAIVLKCRVADHKVRA